MNYRVFKSNPKSSSYAPTRGDWNTFFSIGGRWRWGHSDRKGIELLRTGDKVLAVATGSSQELSGLARVVGRESTDDGGYEMILEPIESLGVKLLPLKKKYARVRNLKCLEGGVVATVYEIDNAAAEYLLKVARRSLASTMKLSKAQSSELECALSELGVKARRRLMRESLVRIRSAALRPATFLLWPEECAVCGLALRDEEDNPECEVAHIRDVYRGGPDKVANALPLCRTHHWAFDRNLWAIHPQTLKVSVKATHRKALADIHGVQIVRPSHQWSDIEPAATRFLRWRWAEFRK